MSRNEIAQKKQYCEEEFELYDKFEKFEYEINTKEIQTTPVTRNIETQTDISESGSCSVSNFDSNDNKNDTKSTAFIVFSSSLIILFLALISP